MFVVIQQCRINLQNVYSYYVKGKTLCIVTVGDRCISYFYDTPEKAMQVQAWLDSKTKVHQVDV